MGKQIINLYEPEWWQGGFFPQKKKSFGGSQPQKVPTSDSLLLEKEERILSVPFFRAMKGAKKEEESRFRLGHLQRLNSRNPLFPSDAA